ncbi:MAG: hypothetical protein AAGE52_07300 [Myxococcota bacterium]
MRRIWLLGLMLMACSSREGGIDGAVDTGESRDAGVDAAVGAEDAGAEDAGADDAAVDAAQDAGDLVDSGSDGARDAGSDADVSEDIACGPLVCEVPYVCCIESTAGTFSHSCEEPGDCSGAFFGCDGPDDCLAGDVCCGDPAALAFCAETCDETVLCETDADCEGVCCPSTPGRQAFCAASCE